MDIDIQKIKDLLLANHNIILNGAPGTGKTFLAKKIAESIGGKWEFVQFHPSYDYTDFVEGLRPIRNGKELGFERKDGVFKAFCKDALLLYSDAEIKNAIASFAKDVEQNGSIDVNYAKSPNKGTFEVSCRQNSDPKSFIVTLNNEKKTEQYAPYDVIAAVIKGTKGCLNIPYSYSIGQYIIKNYLEPKERTPKVFIIDEINRGDMSKIFGELFFSIDPGYRGEEGKVMTQYQNLIPKEGDADFVLKDADVFRDGFYVPENVYIIGTMNDIDRSVESMDFAMRRRFTFQEITAKDRQDAILGSNQAAKDCMKRLNDAIVGEIPGLNESYHIGPAYFKDYSKGPQSLWDNKIKGLLYEYLRGMPNAKDLIQKLENAFFDKKNITNGNNPANGDGTSESEGQ